MTISCPTCGHANSSKGSSSQTRIPCQKCGSQIQLPPVESKLDIDEIDLTPAGGSAALESLLQADLGKELPDVGLSSNNSTSHGLRETPALHTSRNASSRYCSECSAPMAANAVLCINCGFDLRSHTRHSTSREGMNRVVDLAPLPLAGRLFFMLVGMALLGLLAAVVISDEVSDPVDSWLWIMGLAIGLLALAFGSYYKRIATKKLADGQSVVVVAHCFWFLRFPRQLSLQRYNSVWFIQQPQSDAVKATLVVLIVVGLFFYVVPGLILWWVAYRAFNDIFYRAELRGEGVRPFVLHQGRETAKPDCNAIVRMVHSTTGIPKENELGHLE